MTNPKALLFEIQKMSTEDGPGIRTTVFFKQCPLRCIWCHNPESILKKPQLEWFEHKCIGCNSCIEICKLDALHFESDGLHIDREKCTGCGECSDECPSTALHMFGEWWELEDLYHEIQKDKVYYTQSKGGITVSGGEPTVQAEFILEFLKKCKQNDISTALDTCGYASQKIYETLMPFVDLILLDIKEIDPDKHKKFTGVSNDLILKNAIFLSEYVKEANKILWIRTPIIPNYTATEENIRGIGNFIVNSLKNVPERWDLLSFNNLCASKYQRLDMDWPLKDFPLMKEEEIKFFYEVAKSTGVKNIQWSGLTKKTE
ncbi:MAG: glycyl-radical enzyme activating protein [Promethearchaeota archaeon]|nr:MAG: glycyl-radical enzyme activating protein [Candidatus Lokiarchaeota archaeon]